MRRALFIVFASAAALASVHPPAGASSTPVVITPDGNFCVYNDVTDTMACVEDQENIGYAYLAAAAGQSSSLLGRITAPLATFGTVTLARFYDAGGYSTSAGYLDYIGSTDCDAGLSPRDAGWSPMGSW